MKYQPPYTTTPAIVNLVAEIGETIGRYTASAPGEPHPHYPGFAGHQEQPSYSHLIEFMLSALRDALSEAVSIDEVTDQVAALVRVTGSGELGSGDLMQALGLSHRPTFRNNYLNLALEDELIERTQPDSPSLY